MKRYIKNNKIRNSNQIVIIKDGFQIFNPTEEMILEDGWVEIVSVEKSEEELFEDAKQFKIKEVINHDNSKDVNECFINYNGTSLSYWANKSERSTLKTAIQDCLIMGIDTYRLDLRELGVSFNIPCQNMLQMLSALEVYAIQCYNKTTDHIFNINKIENMEDLDNYDFTQGYPEKLVFEI